ncbi:unnamed protein product [Musa hybrid cultivar]
MKELPFFNEDRWENSGRTMYEYEMCSSGVERRILRHVRKSLHQPIYGDMEATMEMVTSGSSLVGHKRNIEESSTLSSAAPKKLCRGLVAHSIIALQSDVSPPPTAVVQ